MKSFPILLTFSLFVCNSSWRIFHRGRGKYGNVGEPAIDVQYLPPDLYFEQKLDHFNPSSLQTWKQRYFMNDTFFKTGGPVFLMIGGEATASPKWMIQGTWLRYAKKYNALCLLIEHRFYGKSHPTGDLSVKNLSYLSSEQALADLAWFITWYNGKLDRLPPPKWVVMGGSYPGSLAAWMRLKYPHLVLGAVSTSGPLLALADFKDYFQVVQESLVSYDPDCVTAVEKGTQQLSSTLAESSLRNPVDKLFKLCDELDTDNEDDVSNLYEILAGNFAGVVQYNKDNRENENRPGVELTIDLVCDTMSNRSLGVELQRLAAVNALILKNGNESCLDYKYEKMITEMRSISWESEVASGTRQWMYQTCTEFGFFQTSGLNSTQKVFGDKFPVEFFSKQCTDVFGWKFSPDVLGDGIKRTNMIYGGMDDRADNVVYVHGSLDPWHALGITRTLKKGAPAIYIEGTAHCANMYPPSPNDPPQLISAREEIESLIGQWLQQ